MHTTDIPSTPADQLAAEFFLRNLTTLAVYVRDLTALGEVSRQPPATLEKLANVSQQLNELARAAALALRSPWGTR